LTVRAALDVMTGQYRDTQFGDTKRFSLQLGDGTVLDLLNGRLKADATCDFVIRVRNHVTRTRCAHRGIA
jgi:hypothetical protein